LRRARSFRDGRSATCASRHGGRHGLQRLTKAEWKETWGSTLCAYTYNYDKVGNRTSLLVDSQVTYYSCNDANELTSEDTPGVETAYYSYDGRGNQTQRQVLGGYTLYFDYNSRNLITAISSDDPAFTPNYFTYNALGQRITKTDSTGFTRYVWDGLHILLELDASGNLKRRYTHGYSPIEGVSDLLAVQDDLGCPCFYHFDQVGGVRQLTDRWQNPIKSYTLEPFGRILAEIGAGPSDFLFPASSTRLVDLNDVRLGYVRAYLISQGRWASRDGVPSTDPYGFAVGNPLRVVDPSSEIPLLLAAFVIGGAIAGALYGAWKAARGELAGHHPVIQGLLGVVYVLGGAVLGGLTYGGGALAAQGIGTAGTAEAGVGALKVYTGSVVAGGSGGALTWGAVGQNPGTGALVCAELGFGTARILYAGDFDGAKQFFGALLRASAVPAAVGSAAAISEYIGRGEEADPLRAFGAGFLSQYGAQGFLPLAPWLKPQHLAAGMAGMSAVQQSIMNGDPAVVVSIRGLLAAGAGWGIGYGELGVGAEFAAGASAALGDIVYGFSQRMTGAASRFRHPAASSTIPSASLRQHQAPPQVLQLTFLHPRRCVDEDLTQEQILEETEIEHEPLLNYIDRAATHYAKLAASTGRRR